MIFKFVVDKNETIFEAIPEIKQEYFGYRMEGDYPPLELINTKLTFDFVPKENLHPDIIASICIFAFYPFIKNEITFPYPVSVNFSESLKYDILPKFEKESLKFMDVFKITNVDKNITAFKDISNNTNWSIAFGGGMDSTAIALLLPDIPLVHLKIREDNEIEIFSKKELTNDLYCISSNIKKITKPNGFPTWASCFLGNMLLASELKTNKMITGTILESSCLQNGRGYFENCCKMTNRFDLFLKKIGLLPVYITGGCSEMLSSKIIFEKKLSQKVLFCERNNGKPCRKCTKCFRKMLELVCHGENFNFDSFDKNSINKLLKSKYFMNVFIYMCNNYKGDNKIFDHVRKELKNELCKETSFCERVYTDFYNKYDIEIKNFIINQLQKSNFDTMDDNDIKSLKNFNK